MHNERFENEKVSRNHAFIYFGQVNLIFFRMSFTWILCMTICKRTYTHNHKIPHQTEDGSTNFHIERFLNVQRYIHIFTYTQIHTDIFFYVHSQSTQVVWLIHHQHITMAYQHALFIPKASVRINMEISSISRYTDT